MTELWKDIKGFEGFYQVSNLGRVKGLPRKTEDGRLLPERYLYGSVYSTGYVVVKLRCNKKPKRYSMHRLVAEHFIPNPESLPIINHKDENKLNNCVDNLEWCTQKYNTNYGCARQRAVKTFRKNYSKEVYQFDFNGNLVGKYDSVTTAAKITHTRHSEVSSCCRMVEHCISANGFMWRYAEDCSGVKIPPYTIKPSSLTQRVAQYTLEGVYIKEFDSIGQAALETDTNRSSIGSCCTGRYKSANGFIWKYV